MIAPLPPPVPCVDVSISLRGTAVDLVSRVLVAGVVPAPRFGRESEVVATAAAVADAGADLVDVSLPPRLIGPVAGSGRVPVAVRVGSVDQAVAAGRAGAAVVLVPTALLADAVGDRDLAGLGAAPAAVVDDLADLDEARAAAESLGVPLAFDASRRSAADAMASEAAAVAEGCRLLRTTDVRRSRRVAEVMGAILGARRPAGGPARDLRTSDR